MPSRIPPAVHAAVDRLAEGYSALFAAVLDAVEPDERIRGLWLSGSLARGTADAGSDLDLIIALRDGDFLAYASSWRDWLASVTPTLVARELYAPGCFCSMTRDCLRLDVIAEPVSALAETPHRHRLVVLDRDGLDPVVPPSDPEPPGPDLGRIASLLEEAYRQIAIFPQAVMVRGDWLLGIAGIQGQRQLLYDVFVEANQPLPPMGVKQYTSRLTPEQRSAMTQLPGVECTRTSVIAGMRATVDAWNTVGRSVVEEAGLEWPADLASTVTAYFETQRRR